MSNLDAVQAMQAAAFAKDWDRFQSYLTENVYYRVGNVAEAVGPRAVAAYLRELPSTRFQITAMDVRGAWTAPTVAIAEYTMRGTRLADHHAVEYPCVDVYRFEGDRLRDWRVYPIEPTFLAPRSAVTLQAPPGPPQSTAAAMPASWGMIKRFQESLRDGNWESASTFLTNDVVLRVGNHAEVAGPHSVLEYLGNLFRQWLIPRGADFIDTWEFPGILLTEMTVHASRVQESESVSYPCVESYRFLGPRIKEWRIYPIEATLLARA
jgi:limonene-1,2-epoxide hydrolase